MRTAGSLRMAAGTRMRRLTEGEESDESQCFSATTSQLKTDVTQTHGRHPCALTMKDKMTGTEFHNGLKGFWLKGTEVQKVQRNVNREWMTHLEPMGEMKRLNTRNAKFTIHPHPKLPQSHRSCLSVDPPRPAKIKFQVSINVYSRCTKPSNGHPEDGFYNYVAAKGLNSIHVWRSRALF